MLKNITEMTGSNMGGIARLFFIEQKYLAEQPRHTDLLVYGNLLFAPGTVWNYFNPTAYSTNFSEEEEITQHGYIYNQELKGFRAKDNLQLAQAWDRLKGKKLILLYKDANDTTRLIGDLEDYVMFTRKFDTQAAPNQRAGYAFTFKGSSTHPALYFLGNIEVSEEGEVNTSPNGGPVTIQDIHGNIIGIAPANSTFTLPDIFLSLDNALYTV